MHRQLRNQLRRVVGLTESHQIEAALQELQTLSTTAQLSPDAAHLLARLDTLLQRISGSYDQYDRDIGLRANSLQLSSDELASANEKLQHETTLQRIAIEQLRSSANDLLRSDGKPDIEADATGLNELVATMATMVRERSAVQHELEMQKFAMDQHAIISIADRSGAIIYANERFCTISGYTLDELLGKNHSLISSQFHSERFFEELWKTISAGEVWSGEICNRNKNGDLYWVSATLVPLLDSSGAPERYIAIRTDITHRKMVEAAVEEGRSFLQSITDTLGEGVFRLDKNMHCIFLNPEAERQLGVTLAGLKDLNFLTAIGLSGSEGAPLDFADRLHALTTGSAIRSEDVCMRRPGGEIFPVSLAIAPLGERGKAGGWVGSFRDITEHIRVEGELRAAKSEADRANQMKSQFLANMSHELRTPLNAVLGFGHLVQQTELLPQQRDYLQKMEFASHHLLGLINDVLDYTKIEAGKFSVEIIPFNPTEAVREVVNLLQPKAQQRQLLLLFEITAEVPEILLGDRKRLGQILLNLTDNALKFTERGQVKLRVGGSWLDSGLFQLEVDVQDSGIGMTAEQIGKLFKPFVQADGSTARRFGGTGLGLAICRELVELMGGHIDVHSEVGKGSRFFFTLPCNASEKIQNQQTVGSRHADNRDALLGYSALIVEDDTFNQQIMLALLKSWGMSIDIADSGEMALQILQEKTFDIIMQDIQLPGIDGYEVVRRIRGELGMTDIPIVALTAYSQQEDRQRGLEVGIDDFLTKPFEFNTILSVLQRLLGATQLLEAGAMIPLVDAAAAMTAAEFNDRLARMELLLQEFDPDALDLAIELERACQGTALTSVVQVFRQDLESYDFVAAKKTFIELQALSEPLE